jgi:hypothetical protein
MRRTILLMATMALTLLVASGVALAGGATQISGVASYADPGECVDREGAGATYVPLDMTGDLEAGGLQGCLYTFVDTMDSSTSGTYRETGTEIFVAKRADGTVAGTFATTYRFEGKYTVADPATEIFGRCQHPIVEGSGTGIYEGVSGTLLFKDDIEAGNFPYRGHLQY